MYPIAPLDGQQKFSCVAGRRFGGDEVGRRYADWPCISVLFSGFRNLVEVGHFLRFWPLVVTQRCLHKAQVEVLEKTRALENGLKARLGNLG